MKQKSLIKRYKPYIGKKIIFLRLSLLISFIAAICKIAIPFTIWFIIKIILKDAPIILLDEASASLDAESESKIQRALGTLIKNKTVIVIAHRLRTITDADQIVVLNNGAVIDKGNCDYLSKNCEYFKKISQITKQ